MPDKPTVSIIIPTLRAGKDLGYCLASIESDYSSSPFEIIVVFNSPKPTEFDLREFSLKARPLQAMTNLGFAAACNLGARDAVGESLIFLNDDMTVQPGWRDSMLSSMENNETSAVGGRIISSDGKKVDFEGGTINLLGWGFQKGHGLDITDDKFSVPSRLQFACGGNFGIKTELYEKSGGFDDEYFAYFEDVDLGWRLRLMGEEISYSPTATANHYAGSTGAFMPPALKWFLQERNALQTIIKNYSDDLLQRILPIAFALVNVRAMVLSDIEIADFAPDRTWREWIINPDFTEIEQKAVWNWLVDNVRESLKTGAKSTRKAIMPHNFLPVDNRGVAGMYAIEWCMKNWNALMDKRRKIQSMRVRSDIELVAMFDDAVRPVLGHPREIESMMPLERVIEELVKG